MPVPKRYFHCSQDLNHDPELWQFTSEFGDRSLRTWLQILVYLDRTGNQWRTTGDWLATLSRTVRQSVANVSRQIGWLTANKWLIVRESAADGSPLVFEAPNWAKYNRSPEQKRSGTNPDKGADKAPLLSLPSPSLSVPSGKKEKKEEKKEKKEVCTRPVAEREPGEVMKPKSRASWDAYKDAYTIRYGHPPVGHAGVNAMLCRLVDKLGGEKAPLVAAYYVAHNGRFYVEKMHPVNLLLNDAEKLHTEWATNTNMTSGTAKQVERRDDAMAQIARVEAMRGGRI